MTQLLETWNTDCPVSSKHIAIFFFAKCVKIVANYEEKDLLQYAPAIFKLVLLKMDTAVFGKKKTSSVQGYEYVRDK